MNRKLTPRDYKLVHRATNVVVEPGATMLSFRDEQAEFLSITKMPDGPSEGRVHVRWNADGNEAQFEGEYYPSVFDCRIVAKDAVLCEGCEKEWHESDTDCCLECAQDAQDEV